MQFLAGVKTQECTHQASQMPLVSESEDAKIWGSRSMGPSGLLLADQSNIPLPRTVRSDMLEILNEL